MPEHILINGPIGSGKSTQGLALAGLFTNCLFVDMSHVLAVGMAFRPDLRKKIRPYMKKGKLVPSRILFRFLRVYLQALKRDSHMVCVGIPRTERQAPPFMETVKEHVGMGTLSVVDLQLSPELAILRCKQRAEAAGKHARADDIDKGIVCKRLKLFADKRDKLIASLKRAGANILSVDCHENQQVTFSRIVTVLNLQGRLFIRPEILQS